MRCDKVQAFLVSLALLAAVAAAQDAKAPAVVCNVKVVSDKVPDVSSLEAWKKAVIKDGMKDQDKAIAIWNSVVSFVHEDSPPMEFLEWENTVNDPIKTYNVYGYNLCNDTAAIVIALARYAGFKAQGWGIQGHCVADVWYDDSWHYLDASFIEYFPKADGKLAGVEEVFESVRKWYAEHPEYQGDANMNKRKEFCRNEGWKKGPDVMQNCPTYDKNGQLPAKTHGWYSDMREFDEKAKKPNIYETTCSMGYRVNIQLRPGEKLIRNWSNKGLQVNQFGGKDANPPGCLKKKTGEDDLCYTPKWGDLAPGRIGNGTLEYRPSMDGLKDLALVYENLTVVVKDTVSLLPGGQGPGTLVIRMPSPYVYLGGELTCQANVQDGGSITVSLSDNNGLDWKEVGKILKAGEAKFDLKKLVGRRYDYRLKFVIDKAALEGIAITHDIQHSQRALPALDKGENTITFSAGPQEGAVTVEGSTTAANKDLQLTVADFHPTLENVDLKSGIKMTGGNGSIAFPVETPGEITAVRVGGAYRARDKSDVWTIEASFDDGKTWTKVGQWAGDARFMTAYNVLSEVPNGATKVLVRLSGKQTNTLMLFNLRIDVDYKAPNAGFAPVKVTYVWDEDGQEKKDEHVARTAQDTWKITCGAKPVMKSIIMELAR
ncbi:MAG: hypothetical protein ACE15C_01930 [Phycisphaerae bacterium]